MAQSIKQKPAQKSMAGQKVAAYLSMAQKSETLWNGVLVFLGAFILLSSIPFYPLYIVLLIAVACGVIALRIPPIGVILGIWFGLPAMMYQSAIFTFFYLLILALVMFVAFEEWMVIAVLEMLILAPFALSGLPMAGWITIVGMAIGALYFGSKKSLAISLTSVSMVLLLSSIWLVQNTAYMPVKMDVYQPGKSELMFSKTSVGLGDLLNQLNNAVGRFFDFSNLSKIWESVGLISDNFVKLLIADSLFLQILGWGIALFLLGYLPPRLKPRPQLMAAFSLLLVLPVYYGISMIYKTDFKIEFVGGIVATIIFLGITEQLGLSISRESEITRADKMKSYGKFGMTDMSVSGDEKSMGDVGGYEDVKTELRDAIITPLENKEIAYTYGIRPPTGILLFGPPGTGKTMLMRALAKELKYNFIEVRCSQILSQWYGESLPYDERLLIKDKDGKVQFREIGKIVEEKQKVSVLSFNTHGKTVFANVNDWIKHKCTSPILEIKTRTGRRIRVTDYHSLFALNGKIIESVPTSKLIPGASLIAIPSRVQTAGRIISSIDFVDALRNDDHGLYIKNASEYVKEAIKKLGRKKVASLLGYRNVDYLSTITNRTVGVRVTKFLTLIENARIDYKKEDLRIGTGSKSLPGIIKIDQKLATFLGLWIAEGSYNRKDTTRISTSEKEVLTISKLCEELFGKITIYEKSGSKGRDIYIGSRPLYVLLRHALGLEDGATKKKMPEVAFNLSRENIAALLRGYYSGDGTVYENQRGIATVEASTVSKELASHVLYLLLYFGIVGTVYKKVEWNGSISYRVCLIGGEKLTKFREIGFLDQEKNKRIEKSLTGVGWFREAQIPIKGALRSLVNQNLPKWSSSNTIGKSALAEEELEFMEFVENDIYLDRVEEINRVEDEEFVYDVSVYPCQNFVAGFGGIFAHNSEKNVKEIFDNARKNAPTVLFFDEIDAIAKRRSSESLDEVGQRVLSEILQQIDGASKSKATVMIIGATNRPDQLDAAMLRPGRLDKIIYMHLPDPEARKEVFKVSLRRLPVAPDIDYGLLARKTERFSGADIKNIVTEAKRLAAKEATAKGVVVSITTEHLMKVIESVKPSTGLAQLDMYEQFKLDFERRVGAEKPKEEEAAKETAVKWEDVAGLDDVKQALLEAIELPLLHEAEMKEFKVKPSKGILLFGPPGTGKTLIVRAAAHELKASFQSLSAAEIMKKGYTQAVTVIKEAFNRARENAPGIIFVDEIETFAPARGMGGSSEILGQFLTEMDGVKGQQGVVVIGATNKPSIMDPAIMRPGRFDKIFYIPPPEAEGRQDMFKIHLARFASGVDLRVLAAATVGFSGADIAEICQSAKMKALKTKLAGKLEAITTEAIMKIIKTRRPSITPQILEEYKQFLEAYGERR